MRLINTSTLQLEEFYGTDIPRYAILSHTWNAGKEVSFQEWQDPAAASRKPGFRKIEKAASIALGMNLEYIWVDTCCIDKTSSAELSEAINSMYAWYYLSDVCYCYLEDVPAPSGKAPGKDFASSRWFSRGWTLQELLAPSHCIFFSQAWTELGSKNTLAREISYVSGINEWYLEKRSRINSASTARRMSWASKRVTTRLEDRAYSLLGIFDINMPLLYGEGEKAFTRLQEEIMRVSNDQTLFCWEWTTDTPSDWSSVLAPSPSQFSNSRFYNECGSRGAHNVMTYVMTNAGLHIKLATISTRSFEFGVLDVRNSADKDPATRTCIPLKLQFDTGTMRRIPFPHKPISLLETWSSSAKNLYLQSRMLSRAETRPFPSQAWPTTRSHSDPCFLITFQDPDKVKSMDMWPEECFDTQLSLLFPHFAPGNDSNTEGIWTARARFDLHKNRVVIIFFAIIINEHGDVIRYCEVIPIGNHTFPHVSDDYGIETFNNFKERSIRRSVNYHTDGDQTSVSLGKEVVLHTEGIAIPAHISFSDVPTTTLTRADQIDDGSDTGSDVAVAGDKYTRH